MDALQVLGCFVGGGMFLFATSLFDDSIREGKLSDSFGLILKYLFFVFAFGVIFSMGMAVSKA
jgi:hypothetical protein